MGTESGEQNEFYRSNLIEEVLIGILLGDGWLEKAKVNARFRFEQSHIRTDFFFQVFKFFCFYSPNTPKLRERLDKRTLKTYKTWHFTTLSTPFFTYYHNLFYTKTETGYKKTIPNNIIELITPVSLAYWLMCDGYKKNKGVGLATNSFSISDNKKLITALNNKFGFNCWMVSDHGQPTIFIPHSDLASLQQLVLPYMLPSLLYKIHL